MLVFFKFGWVYFLGTILVSVGSQSFLFNEEEEPAEEETAIEWSITDPPQGERFTVSADINCSGDKPRWEEGRVRMSLPAPYTVVGTANFSFWASIEWNATLTAPSTGWDLPNPVFNESNQNYEQAHHLMLYEKSGPSYIPQYYTFQTIYITSSNP